MDWKEKAEKWADDPGKAREHRVWMRPSHVDAYLAGVRDALEAAAKVASEHGASEARWAEYYRTMEPDLNEESGCLAQVNAALEIERDIRALGEGL